MDLYGHVCAFVSQGVGMEPHVKKDVEEHNIHHRPKSYKLNLLE